VSEVVKAEFEPSAAQARAKVSLWDLSQLDELGAGGKPQTRNSAPVLSSGVDYLESAVSTLKRGVKFRVHWIPSVCLGALVVLISWASVAEIDQVAGGSGQVISANKVQLIQSLEGGLIEEILVVEGELVEAGQPVLRLNTAIFDANFREQRARRAILDGRMARLLAEAQGFAEIEFPADLDPAIAAAERELYRLRREDYFSQETALNARLSMAEEEVDILGKVKQSVTKLDLLRVRRDAVELRGQLDTLRSGYFRNAMEQYDSYRTEAVALDEALLRDQDRLERATLRAPLRGIVNKIHINTPGRVVESGANIMEIVPHDDSLIVEAKIRPSDVGFLHENQHAIVRFSAFDFTVYGGMPATVEYIGVDTVSNERGERHYPIHLRTDSNILGYDKAGEALTLIPGMVADVSVVTGTKTVLEYLLTPVLRARERALREN